MISNEIKEVVYIAISAMLVALVLGMVSIIIDIRGDLAEVRNSEFQNAKIMQDYREFNKYKDGSIIFGEDIIEVVRKYKDTDITIFVNSVGGGASYYVDKTLAKANPNDYTVTSLQNRFSPNFKYETYLVYNFEDVRLVSVPMNISNVYTGVTGIYIKYIGVR